MAINVSRKELLAVGLPSYVIGVGVAYTLGYWGTFGLNPLQFMGISELARLAIYPLMATLALAIVLMAANYFFSLVYCPQAAAPIASLTELDANIGELYSPSSASRSS